MKKQLFIILFLFPFMVSAQQMQSYYFVFLNSNPNKEVLDSTRVNELQKLHLLNIERLYNAGSIIAAGPFHDGGGLFVFSDYSKENVNKLLQTDPAIAANRFIIEVYPFEFKNGQIGKLEEPYEMISLVFIRLPKNEQSKTQKVIEKITKRFEKESLASAIFANANGGFIVLEADLDSVKLFIGQKEEQKDIQIRNLYIAKGSFCKETKI